MHKTNCMQSIENISIWEYLVAYVLKVNVQNEKIFAWQKIQIFFRVLDIPNFFWRHTVVAGPNPTYEEKVRVPPPPPPPHTHTPHTLTLGQSL